MVVLGHGKSLSLRSHKSCVHGDWLNVKGIVCTYVGHYSDIRLITSGFGAIYSDIRLITSGFGAIAEIRDIIECNIQALIWRYWVKGKASPSTSERAMATASSGI